MTDETERLARIEAKLDRALEDHKDHEGRLRVVEKWKHGMVAVSAVAGVTLNYLLKSILPQ